MHTAKLFQPGHIGPVELRNRVVMAPMGTALANKDGTVSRRQIDYYAERARGGTGLIIIEAAKAEVRIDKPADIPLTELTSDAHVPGLALLAEAIHDYGAKAAMQITAGLGRQAGAATADDPPVAPSAIPAFANPAVTCRPLSKDEIRAIVDACGVAARRAAIAGFDMVEIHGHTGYLTDQFMTGLWNERTDEYGGDLDGRMRFPLEIIEAMRGQVGRHFPIIFRLTLQHNVPGGRRVPEGQEMARRLAAAGIDAIDADAGAYDSMDYIFPPFYLGDAMMADMAAAAKAVVDIPVIAAGNLNAEVGEAILQRGEADFIASGRGLIADPDWPRKVRAGLAEDVCPCIRCNQQCIGFVFGLKPLSCSVNPRAGREDHYRLLPAPLPRRVLVIGGGPAGMEAARVAAHRGHDVTLLERRADLGGQIRGAATPTLKKELRDMLGWWIRQLGREGVDVRLNTQATVETVDLMQPDAVIVATGAVPAWPDIPGIDGDNVIEVLDYYRSPDPPRGRRVLVAGGGLSGCDAALDLALGGNEVTIVEMLGELATDALAINRISLLRLLQEHGVRALTNHRIERFLPNGLVARTADGEVTVEGDTIVVALGTRPENELARRLQDAWHEVYVVGDCVTPAKVGDAVRAGFVAGWQV